jgi:hypothetical protein
MPLSSRHQQRFIELVDADRPVLTSAFVQRGGAGVGKMFRCPWINRGRADYNFSTEDDIKGIVMLEIQSATLKNSTSPPSLPPFFR